MSTVDRTLRAEPSAPLSSVGRIAVAVLDRVLPSLEGGRLDVRLPDGSERSFGAGRPVRIEIDDARFFRRLVTRGKLAMGESYTAGEWRTDDLVGLFELLLRNAESAATRHPRLRRSLELRPSLRARNGLRGARRNIGYHYDLGNDLFEVFLDETMTYSCAVFERQDEPLAEAQRRKLRRVCEHLRLGPDDHVLEIGCGWGSFALVAAGEYGARVTGLTISGEQAALARQRVHEAGLDGRVEIREQDYRTIEGTYSRVASIEMLEAIGERQFEAYFATIDRVLAPGGIACVQTILLPDRRWQRYRRAPDWIERYVFPGCLIPSLGALTRAMTSASRLEVYGLDEIGPDYAETLRRWRASFHERIEDVRRLGYDARFERTWDFYLAFCEAAFRTRNLRDAQLTLTRPADEEAELMAGELYRFLDVGGFRPFMRTLYRIEIAGAERIPEHGPCILVSNHESMLDPFILGLATGRTIRFMAKAELWSNPVVARAMEGFGAFPVDRGVGDAAALGRGAQLLEEGEVLGIFPQGTSLAFRRRPFHRGAARLALVTGAPLIPVCMLGTELILPTRVRYRFGVPQVSILVAGPIPVERGRPTVAAAKALTRRLEETIGELRRPYGPPAHTWLDEAAV